MKSDWKLLKIHPLIVHAICTTTQQCTKTKTLQSLEHNAHTERVNVSRTSLHVVVQLHKTQQDSHCSAPTQRHSRRGSQHQIEAAFKVLCTWTRIVANTLLSNHTHTPTHTEAGTHTHMFGGLWVQLSLQRRHSKLDLLGTAGLHYY